MKYVFSGIVSLGDSSRCYDDEKSGAIYIGDHDVVGEIEFTTGSKVICGILNEEFSGDLFIETGWGYSEYTPMDSDSLKIGDHDLIEIISNHEGKIITLVISDDPIDLMDLS